ncbi:hypothetical protein C8F01DRAFT_206906 [Mycena amicta]|nr:hypothetical protein C8F01DRAFT_206906 [Mycena amicta]
MVYVPQDLASPDTSSTKPRPCHDPLSHPPSSYPGSLSILPTIHRRRRHDRLRRVLVRTCERTRLNSRLSTNTNNHNVGGLSPPAEGTFRIRPSSYMLLVAAKTISRPTPRPPLASQTHLHRQRPRITTIFDHDCVPPPLQRHSITPPSPHIDLVVVQAVVWLCSSTKNENIHCVRRRRRRWSGELLYMLPRARARVIRVRSALAGWEGMSYNMASVRR